MRKAKQIPQKNFGLIEKINFIITFKALHTQTVTQIYRGMHLLPVPKYLARNNSRFYR